MNTYANITLAGPAQADVVALLKAHGVAAYVSNAVRGATVVFHEDLGSQEPLAAELSAKFSCPAIVVMTYGQRVLLYQLYLAGAAADAYVSEHVEELLGSQDAPSGASRRCSPSPRRTANPTPMPPTGTATCSPR